MGDDDDKLLEELGEALKQEGDDAKGAEVVKQAGDKAWEKSKGSEGK